MSFSVRFCLWSRANRADFTSDRWRAGSVVAAECTRSNASGYLGSRRLKTTSQDETGLAHFVPNELNAL